MTVQGPVERIAIEVAGTVETSDTAGVLRGHKEIISPRVYLQPTAATQPNRPLIELGEAALIRTGPDDQLGQAHALSAAVSDAIAYVTGATDATTTAAEALELGQGVCQDMAHALIVLAHGGGAAGALRHRLSAGRRGYRGRRRGSCLGGGLRRRHRLDRLRSGQSLLPGRALRPARLGPRRARGRADPRHIARRRRRGDGRDGAGHGAARPGAGPAIAPPGALKRGAGADISSAERLARAGAPPTRSGPEGSSRNGSRLGRCPASRLPDRRVRLA